MLYCCIFKLERKCNVFDLCLPIQADTNSHIIRRIDISSGLVATLAGTSGMTGYIDGPGTVALFRSPMGVAIGANGTFALVVSTQEHEMSHCYS